MRTVSQTSRRRHPARDHAYLHVDAVQGMYCDLRDIDADLLTVSAHKIHPPILHFETNSKGHWREICDDCWAGANENQPSA
jgi:hypothetical protein